MVSLTWPLGLLSLAAVATGAVVAMRRPLHRIVPVSSLRLWRQAVEAAGPAGMRRPRRISAAWVLLLSGAVVAAVALAGPVWQAHRPVRRVTVAVSPAAELGEVGAAALADSAAALLERLSPSDRVRLAVPAILGGLTEPMPPQKAAGRIREIGYLPVRAGELSVPDAGGSFGPVIRFAPATLSLPDGPNARTIAVAAYPAALTVDAFGVEDRPDGAAEVFVAVRNHTARPRPAVLVVTAESAPPVRQAIDLPPGARGGVSMKVPSGPALSVVIEGASGPGSAAQVVRRESRARTVAMVGRDDPLLRRFIEVHPGLSLLGRADHADMVVAVGVTPPPGMPALVIDPPSPPPGWAAAKTLRNLSLTDATVDDQSSIMKDVDLARVAVREAKGWRPAGPDVEMAAVSMGPDALIVAADGPRRVWVSFDLAAENTNFGMDRSFVIFLARVVAHLGGPAPGGAVRYEWVTPLQAGPQSGWKAASGSPRRANPLPWPGLYRDSAGGVHAVSLPGLRSARPDADPVAAARWIALPSPTRVERGVALWPGLIVLAGLLWMAGWAVRLR